ncbi:uncharacterized protein BX663DRAFT_507037 [Cokeromyces recurvatus]|uniref:uncharacterized protein n=1 Tax=Cokeromyces recurvatus TaxID=90255 RepID=UPI0022207F74|nr:uncharacterized protein BX663DRAFT_507037 [Cokeromyces recurvatus]KAI7903597.1 hypothetical protein BX663DRAFT_507037 [Cokeromyces recurvatus]
MSQSINYGQDEIPHLRSQNDQLWKIIEKQRIMIQNLQKDNVRLSAERDGLQDQLNTLEKELIGKQQRVTSLLISPQILREIAEADDAIASSSPLEITINSPMPPPRSPYRPLQKEKLPAEDAKHVLEQESESSSSLTATTTAAVRIDEYININGRSSPGSPSPTSPNQRKDSAPTSSTNRNHFVPSPSKSSSSLEVARKNIRQQRDSMMPSVRSPLDFDRTASPPLVKSNPIYRNTTSSSRINLLSQYETEDTSHPKTSLNLTHMHVRVVGSNIKPNEKGKEVISFIISIGSNKDEDIHQFEEKWRVEKLYSDFLTLDSKLKAQRNRAITNRIGKLPDKALFSNNAPSKVDQRKIALEQYLQHLVSLPLEDSSDLSEFLCTDVVNNKVYQTPDQKEGYLTKRGKNFGGWKTRYFVLNESVLEYYESKEGTQLGSIRLTNAQIGTQMSNSSPNYSEDSNNVYRHAFLIVEQKRVGSSHSVRHILCANSDDDRDSWVHALLQNINIIEDESLRHKPSKKKTAEKSRKLSKGEIRAISATPISHLKLDHVNNADIEKLTSAPTFIMEEGGDIGMAISSAYNRPTPSISSESTSDSATTYVPSNNAIWTSCEAAAAAAAGRSSIDQPIIKTNTLQTPRPPIVRRSSMSNLMTSEQLHLNDNPHRRAISPTIISRSADDSVIVDTTEPEKKARNKAHRMTFWGKKMLFNSNEEQQQQQQQQQQHYNQPRSSQSTSTIMSSSSISSSTTANTGLRGFLSRSSHENNERQRYKYSTEENPLPNKTPKQVFGVPLEEAVRISRVAEGYELPAIVYRCIEYLDAKDAVREEGLYRLSGSNSTMKALRERFNQEGDLNLLTAKEEYDVHVIAGLFKMWLRELPTSVLTREHRMDFLHVIDLLDRKDRVNELGRLVSVLPLANYTLLRALTAHLIRVVQHSNINKMTIRNVSIVFSPTLGIPPTIFNLFMSEFDYIFWTNKDGDAAPRMIEDEENKQQTTDEQQMVEDNSNCPADNLACKTTLRVREEHGRSNRNSVNYMDGAPNAIVDLEKHIDGPPVLDEHDEVDDLTLSSDPNYS